MRHVVRPAHGPWQRSGLEQSLYAVTENKMKRKQSLRFAAILFCLSGTFRTEATTYNVKAGGGGEFTTIQACANVTVAGDACTVFTGTYPEYVNVPSSGTAAKPITFQVNSGAAVSMRGFTVIGKNYITIGGGSAATGFNITDSTFSQSYCIYLQSTTHVTIQYNYIHECGMFQGIRMAYSAPSSYTVIKGNTITWPAAHPAPPCTTNCGNGSAGILVYGDHTLVHGNDISHVTDFIDNYGSFNVLRNNTLHDVNLADFPSTTDQMHVDGVESDCGGSAPALIHSLYENNTLTNNLTPNSHAWLLQDNGCGSHGVIIRENAILNLGSAYLYANLGGLYDVKDYNNTLVKALALVSPFSFASFTVGSIRGALINDLVYDSIPNNGTGIQLDGTTSSTFVAKNNLGYISSCAPSCTFNAPFGTGAGTILNKNPLFVDPSSDLRLQRGSPARGTGTYLTTVASGDTGSGASLVVDDAGFFQDGSGIVDADWIRVGGINTVQITSVNCATNTITLANGISRSAKDPVYLYKDSNGKVVLLNSTPDIGAYQYGPGPTPPANLTAIPR